MKNAPSAPKNSQQGKLFKSITQAWKANHPISGAVWQNPFVSYDNPVLKRFRTVNIAI